MPSTDTRTSARTPTAPVRSAFGVLRRHPAGVRWAVLAVISAGGAVGGLARYAIGQAWPHPVTGFPCATFTINVTGCLLIGVLMVAVTDLWPSQRLIRPFLGTGVLGGYTTFSTYIVDAQHLISAGAAATALAYLAATVVSALLAVYAGVAATRILLIRRRTIGDQA